MRNNYSSLKGCINYFLISAIISKLNIFSNKQTFHIHLTIIKIKNHKTITHISFKFKKKKNNFEEDIIVCIRYFLK